MFVMQLTTLLMVRSKMSIEQFAQDNGIDISTTILALLKYLADPADITPGMRRALTATSDEDIEDALETMAEDVDMHGIRKIIH